MSKTKLFVDVVSHLECKELSAALIGGPQQWHLSLLISIY